MSLEGLAYVVYMLMPTIASDTAEHCANCLPVVRLRDCGSESVKSTVKVELTVLTDLLLPPWRWMTSDADGTWCRYEQHVDRCVVSHTHTHR